VQDEQVEMVGAELGGDPIFFDPTPSPDPSRSPA